MTNNTESQIFSQKNALRINLVHRNATIRFGTIDLRRDGSVVFASALLNDKTQFKNIEIGPQGKSNKTITNDGDVHVSLHPRGQVAHFRKQSTNEDLLSKKINWFPVKEPFHFLLVRTPPIIDCSHTAKTAEFAPEVYSDYEDSMEFSFYVLPYEDNGLPFMYEGEKAFLRGIAHPNFQLYVTYRFLNEKVKPAILWRNGDWFLEKTTLV